MFHNGVVYGLISTVNSFSFLSRSIGGKLKQTQLIPTTQTNPTILQMLYNFSHLCAQSEPLVETRLDGRPITVVRAVADSSLAPLVPPPSLPPTISRSSIPSLQLSQKVPSI